MNLKILPFGAEFIPDAAVMFYDHFQALLRSVPVLPDVFNQPQVVEQKLSTLRSRFPTFAAVENGRLVGFLGGYILNDLRGMGRKSVYCPEWGHAALPDRKNEIYRALYHAAAQEWTAQEVRTHALGILAHDTEARDVWFWNGFGLLVVDAVRSLAPLNAVPGADVTIRLAGLEDAQTAAQLEAEHWQHYTRPPVLMHANPPDDAAALREMLNQPGNTLWLAEWRGEPVGMLRLETHSHGAADIVQAEGVAAITGLYVRSQARGQGAAAAMLDAALAHYRALDYKCCSVDFESFNPTAAAFWMKYFQPVCFSLMRHPEALL
jgi:ribosomal protein S18 acetylase RimI-like enzyme